MREARVCVAEGRQNLHGGVIMTGVQRQRSFRADDGTFCGMPVHPDTCGRRRCPTLPSGRICADDDGGYYPA